MILMSTLAAIASIAFSITFNVRGKNILLSGICGGLGYIVFFWLGVGTNRAFFFSGMVITLSAEIIARIFKTPATLFLVGGLLPLVPGSEMFRLFQAIMAGRRNTALTHLGNTLMQAGALTAGIIIVGALLHTIGLLKKKIFNGSKPDRQI